MFRGEIMPRPYYQWYGKKWMFGKTRLKLTPLERLVCREICDLASFNDPLGQLSKPIGGGYTPLELAKTIGVSPKILQTTLSKLAPDFLVVDNQGVITIKKWWVYQPDPDKKRKYDANRYQQNKEISQGTHNEFTRLEGEVDIDREGDKFHPPPHEWDEVKFSNVFYESFGRKATYAIKCRATELMNGNGVSFASLLAKMKEYGGADKKWDWLAKDLSGKGKKSWEANYHCEHCKKNHVVTRYPNSSKWVDCPKCGKEMLSKGKVK